MFRLIKWTIGALVLCVLAMLLSNYIVAKGVKGKMFDNAKDLPARKVGLVLGAAPNLYFHYRIEAAYEAWKAGKVKYLILSGDNHVEGYDEPSDMKEALIAKGVPDSCIFLDYAGFRTLDSVVRCKEIFGQDSITIISQEFHNERALYIAEHKGINAIALNAKAVKRGDSEPVIWREYFARAKCLIDLYITKQDPKFLGEKVIIP